jgi:glutamate N-acetyltransferase/amino-acid N-acetyltransferase
MPVNLSPPSDETLLEISGIRLGVAEAAIRKAGRNDLLVLALEPGAKVAAVFTQNRFCAAPVVVARQHLSAGNPIRALLVNTGNANAGTGEDGISRARASCTELANLIGCEASAVLPFSTGVIMEPLPLERILAGLPTAVAALGTASWLDAARAIMTTDTVPKAACRRACVGGSEVRVTGIAKGSGMIHPNMATMLGFIATDARVSPFVLDAILRRAVGDSFNRVTVDGDTSTNDACVLIATGKARLPEVTDLEGAAARALQAAVSEVAMSLAHSIVRDGEGATKFIEIHVAGGASVTECTEVANAIARSPLVKTAFFASDPNLGRILAAIGYAGIGDLDVGRVRLWLGDVLVAENGGRALNYREEDGRRVMDAPEIQVRVDLGRGSCSDTVWTCDLSYDYVKINAEYRT